MYTHMDRALSYWRLERNTSYTHVRAISLNIVNLSTVVQKEQRYNNIFVDLRFLCQLDEWYLLKTLDTIGNCQRPVFSLAVSQHMHTCTNNKPVKIWAQSVISYEIIMREKNTLVTVCIKIIDFETTNSKSEVSKFEIHRKILLSRKLRYFRGSRFLTLFYTINSSPLMVTKLCFT